MSSLLLPFLLLAMATHGWASGEMQLLTFVNIDANHSTLAEKWQGLHFKLQLCGASLLHAFKTLSAASQKSPQPKGESLMGQRRSSTSFLGWEVAE